MLFQPALLAIDHLVELGFVPHYLVLPLEKLRDVVPEEVIGNNEGFIALLTLLARIGETVGVIVVLRRRPTQYALLLKCQKVVNVVWQLVQLRQDCLEGGLVDRAWVLLRLGKDVPLVQDLFPPQKVVWQKAKDSMTTIGPEVDSDFDSEASKLLAVSKSHRDILDV